MGYSFGWTIKEEKWKGVRDMLMIRKIKRIHSRRASELSLPFSLRFAVFLPRLVLDESDWSSLDTHLPLEGSAEC